MPEPLTVQASVPPVQREQRIPTIKAFFKTRKCRIVLENLAQGNSLVTSCERAGINPATYWRWRQKHSILNQATYSAIESRTGIVEDALYKTATEGNVTAQIFFLTNRNPDVWKDRRNFMHGIVTKKAGDGDSNLTDAEKSLIAGIEGELGKNSG